MSINKRIVFAVSTSWLSRFVTISLSLILIPILFRHLGQEELGFWFLLGQSGAFLGLMDLGISPTITRRIAFAKGKNGTDLDIAMSPESMQEISILVATGRIIYRYLSIGVFLIAWILGFIYIEQIELVHLNMQTIVIAWTIMCLSHALGVWASMWNSLLQGLGYVGWDTLISTIIGIGTLVTQIVVVLQGGGLISLAIVTAIGVMVSRTLMFLFIKHKEPELSSIKNKFDFILMKEMTKPALKAWITGLGAFLILKTDQYFIGYFQGVQDIPAYHAAFQIVSNLFILATIFASVSSVFISHLWESGDFTKIQKLVQRNLYLGLSIMVCGTASLLLIGENIFNLWLGDGYFVGYAVLTTFCIMLTLEAQHVIISFASRAAEYEVFAIVALTSGILNIIFTWLLIEPFGLLGVAIGTLLAQLLTNNWFVTYRGLRRLKMSLMTYLLNTIVPIVLVFCIAFGSAWLGLQIFSPISSDLFKILVVLSITGIVFAFTIWILVLNHTERRNILMKVKLL